MNPLSTRFLSERKTNAFTRLKKLCESKVVRWKYWNWPDWYWEPDHFIGLKPERASKSDAEYAYGYDEQNRVLVIRHLETGNPQKVDKMEFLRWSGNKIVGSEYFGKTVYSGNKVAGTDFNLGGDVGPVFEATLSEGRIVRVESTGGNFWDWKTITWHGGKVATVLLGRSGCKAHTQITYAPSGSTIEELDLTKPPKRKPLPKGVTMTSLAKEIRERLAAAVIATVIKAKIKELVYCLALNYDCEGNPLLLPELGIGLDSERRARLKARSHDARLAIWEPEEFSIFDNAKTALQDRDRELDRACDLFNRELEYKGSDEPARKLILQVAADLAKVDWRGKLNTTDDFIVYAVDTDLADLRKNLKLTVPPEQLAKLKAAKLL